MEEKKGNFIDQMKKRLNAYHIEKLKKIQEKEGYQELFKQQNEAKDVLIQMGDASEILQEDQETGYGEITGWMKKKPITNNQNNCYPAIQRGTLTSAKRNTIQSMPSKSLGITDNYISKSKDPSMINYLKGLLVRLQSPKVKKRQLKTENKNRNDDQKGKMKTQETLQQLRKSKKNIQSQAKVQQSITERVQSKLKANTKPERGKFQTIDLGTENRPVLQSARPNIEYQKIRRKSQNQYDIEIAYEKDILQQLIRGTSSSQKANQNYFSTKTQRNPQRFTLKNLLC